MFHFKTKIYLNFIQSWTWALLIIKKWIIRESPMREIWYYYKRGGGSKPWRDFRSFALQKLKDQNQLQHFSRLTFPNYFHKMYRSFYFLFSVQKIYSVFSYKKRMCFNSCFNYSIMNQKIDSSNPISLNFSNFNLGKMKYNFNWNIYFYVSVLQIKYVLCVSSHNTSNHQQNYREGVCWPNRHIVLCFCKRRWCGFPNILPNLEIKRGRLI